MARAPSLSSANDVGGVVIAGDSPIGFVSMTDDIMRRAKKMKERTVLNYSRCAVKTVAFLVICFGGVG